MTNPEEGRFPWDLPEPDIDEDDDYYPYDVVSFFIAYKLKKAGHDYPFLTKRQRLQSWTDVQTMMRSLDRLVEETCGELGLPLPPGWQKWEDDRFPVT